MRGFRLSTVAWSGALTLAFTCSSCSTDSKSDTTGATETDDAATDDTQSGDTANASSNDESPADTREAGTSEAEDDGASEGDGFDDTSRHATDEDSSPNADDTSEHDAAEPVCTQGDTRECVGAGACEGGQICDTSGFWGVCDCGASNASEGDAKDSGVSDAVAAINDEVDRIEGDGATASGLPAESYEVPLNAAQLDDEAQTVSVQVPELDLMYHIRFGEVFAHGGGFTLVESIDDGTYCVSGTAQYWGNHLLYSEMNGIHLIPTSLDGDAWAPERRGVVGIAFTLEGSQENVGLILLQESVDSLGDDVLLRLGGDSPLADGRHAVAFSNVWKYRGPDDPGEAYARYEGTGFTRVMLVVRTLGPNESLNELKEFSYCVSNIALIVAGSQTEP